MKKLLIILGIILVVFGVVYTKYMADLTPQTIVDQPIPLLDGSQTDPSGSNSAQQTTETVIVPTTQVDQAFPEKIVAQETLSQSLNTESKRILGQYTFEQNGAIAMGEFQQGVSGEVKISPDGITAKNVNGDTTFSLDGATGDATFKGTVEANGFTIADENGIRSLGNFSSDSIENDTLFTTTSQTYVDIPSMTLTFTLVRSTRVLFIASGLPDIESGKGMLFMYLNLDGSQTTSGFTSRLDVSGGKWGPENCSDVVTLAAGTHTVKMQIAAAEVTAPIGIGISNKQLSYLILGN